MLEAIGQDVSELHGVSLSMSSELELLLVDLSAALFCFLELQTFDPTTAIAKSRTGDCT